MQMRVVSFAVLAAILTTWTSTAVATNALQSEIKDLISKRKSLNLLRAIIDELDSNIANIHQRSCDYNLPGFNCDGLEYGLDHGRDMDWLTDRLTSAGKKRAPCFNFDGTACVTAQTAEEVKNMKSWKGGPGRRK